MGGSNDRVAQLEFDGFPVELRPFVIEDGVEERIAPLPFNPEVFAQVTFALETALFEYARARGVLGIDDGKDAVQFELLEPQGKQRADRLRSVAFAPVLAANDAVQFTGAVAVQHGNEAAVADDFSRIQFRDREFEIRAGNFGLVPNGALDERLGLFFGIGTPIEIVGQPRIPRILVHVAPVLVFELAQDEAAGGTEDHGPHPSPSTRHS